MAEYILNELFRRKKSPDIGIFIDYRMKNSLNIDSLETLLGKFRDVGSIKSSIIICDTLPEEGIYKQYENLGFSVKIVPSGTSDISFVLESYDHILFDDLDIVVFGTDDELIQPLLVESKNKVNETFLYTSNVDSILFQNAVDAVLTIDNIDSFSFEGEGINFELEQSQEMDLVVTDIEPSVDEMSLGPISEDFDEEE